MSATVAIATAPVQKPKVKTKTAAHYYVLESRQRHEPPKKERRNKRRSRKRERTDIIRAPPAFFLLKGNISVRSIKRKPFVSQTPWTRSPHCAQSPTPAEKNASTRHSSPKRNMANWQPKFEIEFQVRKIPCRWLLDLEWNQARQRYMVIYNPDTQLSANHKKKNLSLYIIVCTVVMPRNAPRMHKQTPTTTTELRSHRV